MKQLNRSLIDRRSAKGKRRLERRVWTKDA